MAYTPLASIKRKELGGSGAGVLPAGAYVCVITEARLSKSKKGDMALLVTWDVAEGEHKGHFSGSDFGHTDWVMLEGNGAPYGASKLDKLSAANSGGPVSFDAVGAVDVEAAKYDEMGRTGEWAVQILSGKMIGLVVGTRTSTLGDNTREENFVDRWVTPDEIRAGKYTDSSGAVKDIRIPSHRTENRGAPSTPKTSANTAQVVPDDELPF